MKCFAKVKQNHNHFIKAICDAQNDAILINMDWSLCEQ